MASMRRISVSLFWLPLFASFSVPSPLPVVSVTQNPAPDQTVRGRVLCIWPARRVQEISGGGRDGGCDSRRDSRRGFAFPIRPLAAP